MSTCICLGTTHSCNPPHYGLWVNLYLFTICVCKHCFLPLLLVFVMKYCVKMHCSLPHNPYCCSLPSPVHLPATCINSSPIAYPQSTVLCWCTLCFVFFWLHFSVFFFCISLFSSLLFFCSLLLSYFLLLFFVFFVWSGFFGFFAARLSLLVRSLFCLLSTWIQARSHGGRQFPPKFFLCPPKWFKMEKLINFANACFPSV